MLKKITAGVVLMLIIGLTVRGIVRYRQNAAKKPVAIEDIQEQNGIPVRTIQIVPEPVKMLRTYSGSVRGKHQADARAKMMERLETILVAEGQWVQRQQVVARLDRTNPQTRYQQFLQTYQLAEKTFQRITALRAEGAVSDQDLDEVTTQYRIAENDLKAAEELLNVRAPITGVITEIYLEEGETVNPGQRVLRVADYREVDIELEVGESEIHDIRTGQEAKIHRMANGAPETRGTVSRIALSADPVDRNFKVWITVPNTGGFLRPGMFVTADVIVGEVENALTIPLDALLYEEDRPYVYVVSLEQRAVRRFIQPGIQNQEVTEILEGVAAGDHVVIEGQSKLRDGASVQFAPVSSASSY